MKFKLFAAGLLSLAMVSPAIAQNAPDDLHCFLLSNVFAKAEKDEKRRTLAGQATMFYLGKIDGRVNPNILAAAMRTPLNPQLAGPQMTACAQRLGRAEQTLQQTIKSVAPKPLPPKH
jgi:hypothetical protein